MNETSSAGGDVFNARDLAPPEVAQRFLPPPAFERLLSKAHCILEGPRGSGKTTLLRMLTPEAYALWRQHVQGEDINFIGIFVPADVRWAKQLSLRVARIVDPVGQDLLQQSVFSVAVGLALIDTIQRCVELEPKFGAAHPLLFFPASRQIQADIVSVLAEVWLLDVPVPSFNGIRLALRKRQIQLSSVASLLAEGTSAKEVREKYPYITSTWLDNLVSAIESVNDVLERPNQLWAVLLDELEIVPQALLQTIVDALRSTSNKVRFKLALSPTGSDLIPVGQAGASSSFEDYRPIKLWYEKKGDARAFASRLFAASLSRALDQAIDVSTLHRILGASWSTEDFDDDSKSSEDIQLLNIKDTPAMQRARVSAFSTLYAKDESFRHLLDEKKIDPRNPPYKDATPEGILVRKITQLVFHRVREIESYTYANGAKRKGGRRGPHGYFGVPNIIDLTEGNPRWVLTMVEALVSASKADGHALSTPTVQSAAIRDFVQQMSAKLMVYPTKAAASGRRWTPHDFVKALGHSISTVLFDGPFNTDPAMSFLVDQTSIDQFDEYIKTAIDLGALVILRGGGPAPLAAGGSVQTLVGARVRITYRLAPEFRLPLLYVKEQKMSAALRAGELLSTSDKGRTTSKGTQTGLLEGESETHPVQWRLI
ncbi:hypothetical protein [Pandoraea pulmonicola]|uniref:Uncharacterized protein n=1 Tax=Pandoraea pulmonicola TaxID=93221 RepID=A0AAJ4Z8Y3_PANPU|nr:hypothetical protein [Pandoraea pulmonicola]SUA88980.1 Uncharacterised protein [Pandoraea pulmonicola]